MILGVLASVLLVLSIGGYFAFAAMSGGGASSAAEPPRKAPPGFEMYSIHGVSIFLPVGEELEMPPSELQYKAVMTETQTVYLMGSTGATYKPMDDKKLKQRLSRMINGGFLGGSKRERNGYPCDRGIIDQATGLGGRLQVEIFQDEGRVIVIGISMPGGNVVVGQATEPEKEKTFYDSFKIGPKPTGGFFGN